MGVRSQTGIHEVTLRSPDGQLEVGIGETGAGSCYLTFKADGMLLLDSSALGLDTSATTVWKGVQRQSVRRQWKPLWGKRSLVPDAYNEAVIDLSAYKIAVRLYNNGMAFRYVDGKALHELTSFHFAGDYEAWSYRVEDRPLGPERLSTMDGTRMPVITIKAGENAYLALHEAALDAGEPLMLQARKGNTRLSVVSKQAAAWRVLMFGRSPGDLVDAHLLELLNPEPAPGMDFSWVKPGVAVWDWRINGAVADTFHYRMSLPSWKRMVDFAAAQHMKALVLDADWYGPEFDKGSDPVKGGKADQVHQIIQYGKEKGIGVWLYLNDVGGRQFPIEQTLKQYGEWGAAGVKYGFMRGSMEEKNERTRLITRLCAENRLLVDYHDNPVHPYGQMRTWPNAVTREYCHAQLDAHRVFTPGTFVSMVYVNMLAGPLDMNNGTMDMEQQGRVDNPMPVPATVTAEIARTLITFSGATIVPDIPENYSRYPHLLSFLAAQQMPWQESKTLAGEIGEFIVMARQNAVGEWLIGAATNEKGRTVTVPLSFLGKGKYEAVIMEDGADADFRTNKTSTRARRQTVDATQTLPLTLAPGGGACVLLRR